VRKIKCGQGKIDPKKWGGTPDWDKYINTYYPYQ